MDFQNNRYPRVQLASIPSPLINLRRICEYLHSDVIYCKRDDLLGRMLGGNKLRKLEYILPEATESGADTLITTGSFESNHVCLTVTAARMLGLEAAVVIMGPEGQRKQTFNEMVERRLGATITKVSYKEGDAESRRTLAQRVREAVDKLTTELRARGNKPYFVPAAGCCPKGSYAFFAAFNELHTQMKNEGLSSYDILLAVGTGSTYSGLLCGVKHSGADVGVYGISIARANPHCVDEALKTAEHLAGYLNIRAPSRNEMNITDEFIGEGYAKPTEWSERGVKLGLELEGLLLDHTYTGKAMGALEKLIRNGCIGHRPVVFWHTGGVSGAVDLTIS